MTTYYAYATALVMVIGFVFLAAGLARLFVSIAVSAVLNLNVNYAVALAVLLPQGLPSINFPKVPLKIIIEMILPAIGIFLVPYREALGAVREFIDIYVAELHGTIMATLSIKI
jgi:MFS superfamily sulfate permease-like transporter